MSRLAAELEGLGGADVTETLEELTLPAFVIDLGGTIRWQNPAAITDGGHLIGQSFERAIPFGRQKDFDRVRNDVLAPGKATDLTLELQVADGSVQPRQISVAPLRDGGSVIGMFGLIAQPRGHTGEAPAPVETGLTKRQLEILRHLADGKSTAQIAEELFLTRTTVRNHVAHVLATLGVHTRVQAVIAASRAGLIHLPPHNDG
jgi:DNA-binding CsgD family transcriptional regulator